MSEQENPFKEANKPTVERSNPGFHLAPDEPDTQAGPEDEEPESSPSVDPSEAPVDPESPEEDEPEDTKEEEVEEQQELALYLGEKDGEGLYSYKGERFKESECPKGVALESKPKK